MGEDEQQKITSYEEMFRRIKEATGVSDTKVRSRMRAYMRVGDCAFVGDPVYKHTLEQSGLSPSLKYNAYDGSCVTS